MDERGAGSWAGCLALCALLLAAGLVACRSPDDATWERVHETAVLRVGMDASFPPFESVEADGSLVGFDVDLARELSRRLGVEPEFVANLPYDGLYDALMARRVDVVISAVVINPARTADFAYSTSYFDAGEVLVVREGDRSIRSVADLEARDLAVVFGTPGDQEARGWARRSETLSVLPYAAPEEALLALHAGDVDAAVVDHVSVLEARGTGYSLTVAGEFVVEVPYAVVTREDSQRLLREINGALAALDDDGTLDRLAASWFGGRR